MMNHTSQNSTIDRRSFLKSSTRIGFSCGLACLCPLSLRSEEMGKANPAAPDPKKLNYCGYTCPPDCPMKLAGESGDVDKKREAYEMWHLKERYGLEFDADQILCNGCKTDKKELGMAVSHCPARKCAKEKKLDSCIECGDLKTCSKDLWKRFPQFHQYAIGLQEQLLSA